MALINLYLNTQLDEKVVLSPNQLNNNLNENIFNNLKKKVEGKTGEHGIIVKVNKLINYDYGMIEKANFSGSVIYKVNYDCLLCSPIKNLEIICQINNFVKGLIVTSNGPIIAVVQTNNINSQIFSVNNNDFIITKSNIPLKKKDFIKISIISYKVNLGEPNITCLGKLLDIASSNEIKIYNDQQALINDRTADQIEEFI